MLLGGPALSWGLLGAPFGPLGALLGPAKSTVEVVDRRPSIRNPGSRDRWAAKRVPPTSP
eukprot:691677-Pyramimonas_sp.AAC.1